MTEQEKNTIGYRDRIWTPDLLRALGYEASTSELAERLDKARCQISMRCERLVRVGILERTRKAGSGRKAIPARYRVKPGQEGLVRELIEKNWYHRRWHRLNLRRIGEAVSKKTQSA